jgi:CubicO group peptidase (beta-lactamase class C family)
VNAPTRRVLAAGAAIAAAATMAAATSAPPPLRSRQETTLAARLEAVRKAAGLPAIAGASFRAAGVLAVTASGVRREGDPVEVTTGDLWHVGSITKSFTSALVGRQVERRPLSWASTLGEVFGAARARKFAGVSLVDLLSHRAGLPANVPASLNAHLAEPAAVATQRRQVVDVVLAGDPLSAPGEQFLYSNVGYIIAGAMLEEKTGRSWEDLIRADVAAPLKLSSVGFGAPGAPRTLQQPRGHRHPGTPGATLIPIEPPLADNPPFVGPAGTLHMTIGDLARWGQEHLRGERGTDGVLTAATFRRLHQPPRSDATYALGWAVRLNGSRRTIWHNGSNTMWYAIVAFDAEADWGVVIVTNGSIAAARAIDAAAAEFLKAAR